MDLSSINPEAAAEQPSEMILLHPTSKEELKGDDGQPIKFFVKGAESTTFRNHMRQLRDSRINKRDRPQRSLEVERESTKALSILVSGWSGNWEFNGEKPVFSTAKALEILGERKWIRDQIDEHVAELGNFLPA